MKYWLVKSEPSAYSWNQMVRDKRTHWNGVRNYQASNNLKEMKKGDHAFFYHSNEGKEIVGIVEVVKEYYPDPSDKTGRFGMVDFKPVKPLKTPATLADIKADKKLQNMALVRQSRLSVCPVTAEEWKAICKKSGV